MNPFEYIENPKYAIVDFRANQSVFDILEKYNLKVIKTIECKEILRPVCGHPDMVLHPIDNKNIVVAPNVYDYYNDMFKNSGIKVIKGGKTLDRNYPNDIAYNVARIGNYAIHNVKFTDEVLKYYLQKSDISFVHVNQGYSKCSMACLCNKAITSDVTIYNTLKSINVQSLYINPKNICLKGFDYGFIGGSIGLIDNKTLLLTGEMTEGIDKDNLYDFVINSGYSIKVASNEILTDLGTIIIL